MRIRSIKPEFWRSDDIDALDWHHRLVFIGLWSYVDDNGVGVDKLASICADLFAGDLERDPRETFARVSEALQTFAERGLIQRYSVDGRAYLFITGWKTHQRIDKPGKPRYPLPTSENAVIRESLATPSREFRETLAPGTGEQGNRGTDIRPPVFDVTHDRAPERETGEDDAGGALVPLRSPRGGREVAERLNATAHSAGAHAIAREYAQHSGNPIPGKVLGDIAQRVDECLASGVPPEQIARGLIAWHDSPITATSQIPGFVHKAAAKTARRGRSKPTDRALDATQIAEQMIREGMTRGN
ncbi:hypothetical protein [Nocardia cyriacigeorgica]|uniref:hypothetical protein n=1 Tax=Nocardia cyriacigeorgica TaxID=135487 RepID=UPI0024544DE0|nr:hypothetical protein [Nocardia cyriacigeorgica]